MTRVLVVDDQELVRAGFRLILERSGMDVVGEAADGLEAVTACAEQRPDVVLMDVRMPRLDGIEATRRILAAQPDVRALALTTFDLDEHVYAAVRAGANGFLLKDVSPADLVHAVEVVARGEAMLAPALTRRLLERFASGPVPGTASARLDGVPEREREVLTWVARGLSNTEIGARLFLSEATVKTYVSRLLTRLDLRDRVQLAVLAYECGLVRPGGGAVTEVLVPVVRVPRWLENFASSHGAPVLTTRDGALRGDAADGSWFEARLPFGRGYAGPPDVDGFLSGTLPPQRWGVLLVRRGGFAVARLRGTDVVADKVGRRHVQGQTKAGGWSQQRFARRRSNQARQAFEAAADHAVEVLGAGLTCLVTGGDRAAVDEVLADPRLGALVVVPPWLAVPDPRRAVLESAIQDACSVTIVVVNA